MPETKTKNLEITYLSQNQTNKEILVNEGFLKIDSLLNNGAISKSTATPPTSPNEGDLYIITDSGATGDWLGQENKLTYYLESKGWVILSPNEGITLWVNDENKLYTFDGTNWITSSEFDNLSELGINATADSTNRLAVKSNAILLDNNGSDSQVKVNKSSATDTASHLFQTNYSGRAEFGLTGDDDFHVKVSSDGASWNEAIKINNSDASSEFYGSMKIENSSPMVVFSQTDATSNSKNWSLESINSNSAFALRTQNDSGTPIINAIKVSRSGTSVSDFEVNASTINLNGDVISLDTYSNTTANAANLVIDSSGNFLRSTSSEKYKKDIEDISNETAKKLLKMRPVKYRSNSEHDNSNHSYYGLIAEEVAEIDPRLVTYNKDGEIESVQYERLTVFAIKILQELCDSIYPNDVKT